jgi:hypothetical protein
MSPVHQGPNARQKYLACQYLFRRGTLSSLGSVPCERFSKVSRLPIPRIRAPAFKLRLDNIQGTGLGQHPLQTLATAHLV